MAEGLAARNIVRRADGKPSFFTPHPSFPEKAKASSSFLKERTKKLLTPPSRRSGESRDSRIKAFCFFFSKKKGFLAFDAQDLRDSKTRSSGKQSFVPAIADRAVTRAQVRKVFWFFSPKKNCCLAPVPCRLGVYRMLAHLALDYAIA